LNKQLVKEYLWNIDNRDEISELWSILKQRAKQIDERLTTNFVIGDKVTFKDKNKVTTKAEVIKVNRKSIIVLADSGHRWKISPSLLTKEV
jgi:hypothetical protein